MKVHNAFYQVWIDVLTSNTCIIYHLGGIDVPLLIVREFPTGDCKPQGTKNGYKYGYKNRWVEVNRKRSSGRNEVGNPPSTNASSS